MKIIAAYLLAIIGGNASPDAGAINQILESVGAAAEEADISAFLGDIAGKDIWEVVAAGSAKLASAPTGGAAVAAAPAGAASSSAAAAEETKEEAKKEESEADVGGTFDLFGGEGGDAGADY